MLKGMFKKTYTFRNSAPSSRSRENETKQVPAGAEEPSIPEGMWRKCNKCGQPIYVEDVKSNYYICPKCKGYFRVHAYRRLEMLLDEGSFVEWDKEMDFSNPLNFPGYQKKAEAAKEKTNLNEAIVTGKGEIHGLSAAIGVCDARFLMSSMGQVVGEKITRMVEQATAERLPVIIFACSGGARMQEGIVSLMQMAKTAAALKKHHEAGQLFISVLTDPTTGGVTASFAMLGDVILAEPGALIGFAGPRVIQQTIGQKLPEGFQRAEFLLEHGFIDRIVKREEQREILGGILKLHRKPERRGDVREMGSWFSEGDSSSEDLQEPMLRGRKALLSEDLQEPMLGEPEDLSSGDSPKRLLGDRRERPLGVSQAHSLAPSSQGAAGSGALVKKTAWDHVMLSRDPSRPVAADYIEQVFDHFIEFHGDRYFGDDGAIVGGIASFEGVPVTVIAQQKGRSTKENIKRNFGMPSPEGYRKALRLMKQAETFGRPIICLVDTPGAFCGLEAEERGQGEAIARNLFEMADLAVPVLSIVVGEGGSGGALAMAVANEVWMMENAIYSILSPEGFASILWKDSKKAADAAKVMKITAEDLMERQLIERIIPEQEPATEATLPELSKILKKEISRFFARVQDLTPEELKEQRYNRFRRM